MHHKNEKMGIIAYYLNKEQHPQNESNNMSMRKVYSLDFNCLINKLCTNIHLKSIAGIKGKQKSDKMQQISCVFNMVRDLVHSLEKLWKIHSQDVLKYGRMFELIKNYCCVVYNTGNLEITLYPRKKC